MRAKFVRGVVEKERTDRGAKAERAPRKKSEFIVGNSSNKIGHRCFVDGDILRAGQIEQK
jgi:hypothetical protein